jgi:hypothetical protein
MTIALWILAALVYLVFRLWYDGQRKPLTSEEIEHYVQLIRDQGGEGMDEQKIETVRRFMQEDDGNEFIMVNLVEFNDSPVTHPETGEDIKAPALLTEYTRPFLGGILRRAGHPVIAGRGVGGYLDAWNTPEDPGWHMVGLVRYRSRRDVVVSSFADPAFAAIHKYKIAAMKQTFAFPMQTRLGFYASPRWTVALLLALGASLLQLVFT